MRDEPTLTPALLLQAYRVGVFPMSEGRDDPEVFWVDPKMRGVIPLDGFRISRSLARTMRRGQFSVTVDAAFEDVVAGCADRPETWISDTIFDLYAALFRQGHAHSIEVWRDKALVGGVYGVTVGAAFFGESMFSRATDASKVALAYLVDLLCLGGFTLFDTQFITPHLASLGAIEIPRAEYRKQLAAAVEKSASFDAPGPVPPAQDVLQRNAQTS
ncbi:leucyl/phenylalanyl-tRNA--protein transferase [Yoonia sediminilitoris]|uniref:Leucyl/phenylalanyl-tRNA--protein transferase n=1 Tax=Yoonia sediminilitoris TaxID=1286148 RepID=A0A2T6KQP2_9RHOB|nr:leucyl/phenylalanyl-tRNA--protein transferase [Yoonia sediminilitoris]PUB18879.1 leucyl/phenylalanyl-tRNA--protein transferase [Yoonia sediminilitoris]RCW99047.1 leucyl/phenylalanyl-tRNA--protein transferase [Yoonia sediminilitoris]